MSVHIFGIRHHGPGCARSLLVALTALKPDVVLVEGPPDAHDVMEMAARKTMKPPVALLVYQGDRAANAVFYPFAIFSPEWQAIQYGVAREIPVRFMDLPMSIRMALQPDEFLDEDALEEQAEAIEGEPPPEGQPSAAALDADATVAGANPESSEDQDDEDEEDEEVDDEDEEGGAEDADGNVDAAIEAMRQWQLREDPLGVLAEAAGYNDRELWWEHQIEQRLDAAGLFEGIMEAMTALRAQSPAPEGIEALREAHMRQTIRTAEKEGHKKIAVVCGAWHGPALVNRDNAQTDADLLKGTPKTKVVCTWIPWSHTRLAYRSGYGAGVNSPGWYEHLWTQPEKAGLRWVARAAQLLREQDLDASSASVIEAVRLADALAAMHDLPMPGLSELNDAVLTVLCHGERIRLQLIRNKLELGDQFGEVPPDAPAVPLQRDLDAKIKRLRLKVTEEIQDYDFDLRKDTDRERSQLFHQLNLLGIPWATLQPTPSGVSTFHELWKSRWQVGFPVRLIEMNVWGNTVEDATTARVCRLANDATELPQLTTLLDGAILAALPQAIDFVLSCLQGQAAVSADVRHMMDALPPLAKVARYGDVRATPTERILPVVDGIFERIVVGLAPACASLDDAAAAEMVTCVTNVQKSLEMLNNEDQGMEWHGVLRRLLDRESVHGLVRGYSCRLLVEHNIIDQDELQRLAGLALSPVNPPIQATTWLEGLLRGSGQMLLHQDGLWTAMDHWLRELTEEAFKELLPLLRRAFASFSPQERRSMGEKIKEIIGAARGQSPRRRLVAEVALDHQRAALVLPVLAHILGTKTPEK